MMLNISADELNTKCGLTANTLIVVGVSGGPDSLCLLDLLISNNLPVIVAHYDHHLRNDSGKDAGMVRQAALHYGVPFHLGEGDVSGFAIKNKMSIEEAARVCRYRFLFDLARNEKAEAVAVAHSADDQVETILMHLLRGAGLSGLKGMVYRCVLEEWDTAIALVRPLLGTWREEILIYCQDHQLSPVTDQTNQDVAYFRNRLRHELIPYLSDYNLQIKKTLWRMAQSLESDFHIVQETTQKSWDDLYISASAQAVTLKYGKLSGLSVGIQRNIFRKAFLLIRPSLRDIDFEAIERAVGFIEKPSLSGKMDLIDGIWLVKIGDDLRIGSPESQPISGNWPQMAPENPEACLFAGRAQLESGWQLAQEVIPNQAGMDIILNDANQAWFDLASLSEPLMLRARRNGDRFKPFGMDGRQVKLSDFFINEHIPAAAREKYPLVCCGDEIIWIPGIRAGQTGRVGPQTQKILHLTLSREK